MRFLIDAHLPLLLKHWLVGKGYSTIHTRELPQKNETEDEDIIRLSSKEGYIIVSKDEDFYTYYILNDHPFKLLWITTGNITNSDLIKLFEENFEYVLTCLSNFQVVELSNEMVTVHF